MSDPSGDVDRVAGAQRDITMLVLATIGSAGFALAGSGAIREHGLTRRTTEDVDLFTTRQDPVAFLAATESVLRRLTEAGHACEVVRRAPLFVRIQIRTRDDVRLELDLGVDWRAREPVASALGPVLSIEDAVSSKVGALYSRGEPRDYLDVDAIRASGRFTDDELVAALAERDPGFDLEVLVRQLTAARRITPVDVRRYGVTAIELEAAKRRFSEWAERLRRRR